MHLITAVLQFSVVDYSVGIGGTVFSLLRDPVGVKPIQCRYPPINTYIYIPIETVYCYSPRLLYRLIPSRRGYPLYTGRLFCRGAGDLPRAASSG